VGRHDEPFFRDQDPGHRPFTCLDATCMNIPVLGSPQFPSPIARTVDDNLRLPEIIVRDPNDPAPPGLQFEVAGPRARLFFDPPRTRAAIVTCGGLCPGMNHVIRSLYLELGNAYGIREVLGVRGGFQGLDPACGEPPIPLTPQFIDGIHKEGGTVLGTSRGPVDVRRAVEELIRREVNILFTIGGDGTQRGGNELFQEARRRGHALSVVGIPKTIDNDVAFVSRTFGYLTAVEEASRVLQRAHTEVRSVHNGVALVKLMGRHAGFIAGGATVVSQDVNFTLIPEVPFRLEGERGFLATLRRRIVARNHAVIVVAEGAGQELLAGASAGRDASGNIKLRDIGQHLRDCIESYFAAEDLPIIMRYFDPSYFIRSSPANAEDSILCDLFARHAAHAAMAGKTGMVIGLLHERFIHVPIELLVSRKKRLDPSSTAWSAVLAATGQPEVFA
jgi:6-phosphofructokinase 1